MVTTNSWTATSGAWSFPGNWSNDAVPGSSDSVSITGPGGTSAYIVSGTGGADSLTLSQQVALSGTVTVNSVTLGAYPNSATLLLLPGAAVNAGMVVQQETFDVVVDGGTLRTGGDIDVHATASLTAADGGLLVAPNIRSTAYNSGTIWVDPQGAIEIGAAGSPVAGAIAVDAGATLDWSDPFSPPPGPLVPGLGASVVDNGLITTDDTLSLAQSLTGTGTVAVGAGEVVQLLGSVGAAVMPEFTVAGGTIVLGDPAQFDATIAGMVPGDVLLVDASDITDITYTPPDGGAGFITLLDGTAGLGTIALAGSYAADRLLLQPAWARTTIDANAAIQLAVNSPGSLAAAPAGTGGTTMSWAVSVAEAGRFQAIGMWQPNFSGTSRRPWRQARPIPC